MIKVHALLIALFLTAAGTGSAFADSFNFSFSGPLFSGSGQLIATDLGSDAFGTNHIYGIDSATGTVDTGGASNSMLSLLSPNSYGHNDNLLYYPKSSFFAGNFDTNGVSFLLSDGAMLNLFSDAALLITSGGVESNQSVTIFVTSTPVATTPEPSSLILLGTGFATGLVAVRRKLLRS
jgi:hypothetical protein